MTESAATHRRSIGKLYIDGRLPLLIAYLADKKSTSLRWRLHYFQSITSSSKIHKIVIIIIPVPLSPTYYYFPGRTTCLLVVFCDSTQEFFQLVFGHFRPQLPWSSQHDQSVFYVDGPRFLDEADPSKPIRSFGKEYLSEDGASSFRLDRSWSALKRRRGRGRLKSPSCCLYTSS